MHHQTNNNKQNFTTMEISVTNLSTKKQQNIDANLIRECAKKGSGTYEIMWGASVFQTNYITVSPQDAAKLMAAHFEN